jgi:hypothetical protein
MTRRNDIDEGHSPVATTHALGAAQNLVALLRDGISIARASSKFTGRGNKRGSESTREARSGKEHGTASDRRNTESNRHGESAASGGVDALSAAKLVSKIATVTRSIDRFDRQQNSWRKDLPGVSLGAERSLGVSRIEKSIAAGKNLAPRVSIARLMQEEGMVNAPVSRQNLDADRIGTAAHLLEGASVKRVIAAGTGAIGESTAGLSSRQFSMSDRSARRLGGLGKQPGFLDAAASIAAQPNNVAARQIKRVEFAEPTK